MLGEADLMALDEDLQEVPWGLVAPTRGDNQQILSPLAALGARAEGLEWGRASPADEG